MVRASDPAPGAAGELASRWDGALEDRRDLLKRYAEHVVKHECQALCRRKSLEHHDQCQPYGIGDQHLAFWIAVVVHRHDRLGKPPGDEILAPGLAGTQHVEADTADDRRQPAAHVLDLLDA